MFALIPSITLMFIFHLEKQAEVEFTTARVHYSKALRAINALKAKDDNKLRELISNLERILKEGRVTYLAAQNALEEMSREKLKLQGNVCNVATLALRCWIASRTTTNLAKNAIEQAKRGNELKMTGNCNFVILTTPAPECDNPSIAAAVMDRSADSPVVDCLRGFTWLPQPLPSRAASRHPRSRTSRF